MAKINGKCREVMDKTEWVAITSLGSDGPHMVGTWGDYIRSMSVKDDEVITIPARRYNKTEENLKENGHVELLTASKQVRGSHALGGKGAGSPEKENSKLKENSPTRQRENSRGPGVRW